MKTALFEEEMTSGDLKRFFEACNEQERRMFSTVLLTGMRKGEFENLTWLDIQFELGIIFIQAKEGWDPKSDEGVIPISPVLYRILPEHWEYRRSDHWVFANKYASTLPLLDCLGLPTRAPPICSTPPLNERQP